MEIPGYFRKIQVGEILYLIWPDILGIKLNQTTQLKAGGHESLLSPILGGIKVDSLMYGKYEGLPLIVHCFGGGVIQ